MTTPNRTAAPKLTDIARIDLSCGSFDALRAIDFSRTFPPHFHDTFAIGVIESGATRLRTRRGEWIGRAGTVLAFSPGEIHAAEPLTEHGFTYRMIYPSVDLIREIGLRSPALRRDGPLFTVPVIDDPALAGELARAHVPLMDGVSGGHGESRFIAAVRALVARYASEPGTAAGCRLVDMQVVERAREYLRARFTEAVRIRTLADVCGVSPYHLIRVFHRVVGVPPYAYLIQLRVNRAQAMLCKGACVADVAYACGFSDQSHLTRTFRKAVGIPPGQYLRSVRAPAA